MYPEQDEFRRRAIRAALMVAGIAVVIGLLVGGVTSAVIYVSGVLPDAPQPTAAPPDRGDDDEALPSPSLAPTPSPSPSARAGSPSSTAPSASASPSAAPSKSPRASKKPRATKTHRPAGGAIRLHAGAGQVGTYERVTLSGRYPGGNGTTLQVQRREGGSWAPFPTSATVNGGTFSTYVASGQSGPNRFRVVDPATGRSSNVVVVNVS